MTQLNTAIPLYVGYGVSSFPKEDATRLVGPFGPELGAQLAAQISKLLAELDGIKPDWSKHDLVTASKWAVAELKRSHPELDEKATAALEWIYSWWWK